MNKTITSIVFENIEETLAEIENRIKQARLNIKHYHNPEIAKISAQNIIYATYSLRKDIEVLESANV